MFMVQFKAANMELLLLGIQYRCLFYFKPIEDLCNFVPGNFICTINKKCVLLSLKLHTYETTCATETVKMVVHDPQW